MAGKKILSMGVSGNGVSPKTGEKWDDLNHGMENGVYPSFRQNHTESGKPREV